MYFVYDYVWNDIMISIGFRCGNSIEKLEGFKVYEDINLRLWLSIAIRGGD